MFAVSLSAPRTSGLGWTPGRAPRVGNLSSSSARQRFVVGSTNDSSEQQAERIAHSFAGARHAARSAAIAPVDVSSGAELDTEAAARVEGVFRSPGKPLDPTTRAAFERRLGHDFSKVRIHTDERAAESARTLDAQAYTVGPSVVFDSARYAPGRDEGRLLLAHELAHVAQHSADAAEMTSGPVTGLARPLVIRRYRSSKSFNFGRDDTAALHEAQFTDPKTQPWIERITVNFDRTSTDSNGDLVPTGTATASYHANPAARADISLPVTGGSTAIGLTNAGSFTVTRIEGIGYNDQPLPDPEGEGPRHKYSRTLSSSMHYAVFFHRGQALHIGSLNLGSHACVHMGNDATAFERMKQINYHSVVGRTHVVVSYDSAALTDLCCSRMTILGVTKKGAAPNPCKGADPAACP